MNRCEKDEDKMFLLKNSNKNTTTCHMNNPSFHHLNLSTKWICISSLCGKLLGEIFQCENGHVIDNAQYCDTKVKCEGGSDEQQQSFGFRCSGKSRKSICALRFDVAHGTTDEKRSRKVPRDRKYMHRKASRKTHSTNGVNIDPRVT